MNQWKVYKRGSLLKASSFFLYLVLFFIIGSLMEATPVQADTNNFFKVSTYAELKSAVESGKTEIVFTNDINADTNTPLNVSSWHTLTVDGAGYTLDFKKNSAGSFLLNRSYSETTVPNLILKNMNLKKDSSLSSEPFVSTSVSEFVYVQFEGKITFDKSSSNGYVKLPLGKVGFLNADVKGYASAANIGRVAFNAQSFEISNTKMNIDQDRYSDGKSRNIFASYKTGVVAEFVINHSDINLKYNNSDTESYYYSLIYAKDGIELQVTNDSKVNLSGKAPSLYIDYWGFARSYVWLQANSIIELTGENQLFTTYETYFYVDSAKLLLNGNANRKDCLAKFKKFSPNIYGNQIVIKNSGEIRSINREKDAEKPAKASPNAFDIEGSKSQISVSSGGKLILDNRLYDRPPISGTDASGYAAIRFSYTEKYASNLNVEDGAVPITAEGQRTEVNIDSDYGSAINKDGTGALNVAQKRNTIMQLKGSSAGSSGSGVISGENFSISMDAPYFYDFTNVRKDGGAVFSSKSSSTLRLLGSDFSVWDHETGAASAPSYYYSGQGVIYYTGTNLNRIGSDMDPTFGSKLPYLDRGNSKRIFGTKAAPIFTGLRTPTNADKRIFASVAFSGVDASSFFIPSENAIYAKVKITSADGTVKTMISGVKGFDSISGAGGVKTWEETAAQGGRIEFLLDSYLQVDDEVEIIDVWRNTIDPTSPEALHANLTNAVTKQKTVDVIPPELLYVDEEFVNTLTVGQKSLSVGSNSKNHSGDYVELFINNRYEETTTIKEDGSFSLDLKQALHANDVVQFSVRNHNGSIIDNTSTLNSKFQQPLTNNDIGNSNPIEADYNYHDQNFTQAVKYVVKDITPPSAGPKVTPIKLGDSQSIEAGDLKSFLTNVKDDDTSVDKITAKLTVGQDINKLVSTIGLKDLYIDLTDESGNTAKIKTQINVYEDTLIVEFITAEHEALHPPIKIKKDGAIDLTKEQTVIDAIAKITSQNYQLYERPTNETQLIVPPQSDLIVSYKFDGSLNLISAPVAFDFGTKVSTIKSKKYTSPTLTGEPLIVSDTRTNKVKWQLKAKLDQPLTNVENEAIVLPDTIKYNDQGNERTLTDEDVVIFSHLNTTSGNYNVTEERWTKGDGFLLSLPEGVVKSLGKYHAQITITLENAK